jgi:thiamine-monophosphate kinase
LDDAFAREIQAGLIACCRRFRFGLAGGDFSSGGAGVCVSVSLLGQGPAAGASGGPWLRSGAEAGDQLLVTGALGGSRGRKHLEFMPRLEEARRIRELAGAAVHAAIDLTDGLARDVIHMCQESLCGVELTEEALPVSELLRGPDRTSRSVLRRMLGDGEDFELLLALEAQAADRLLAAWDHPTPLTRIGRITPPAAGMTIRHRDGRSGELPDIGYEHLTASDGSI